HLPLKTIQLYNTTLQHIEPPRYTFFEHPLPYSALYCLSIFHLSTMSHELRWSFFIPVLAFEGRMARLLSREGDKAEGTQGHFGENKSLYHRRRIHYTTMYL